MCEKQSRRHIGWVSLGAKPRGARRGTWRHHNAWTRLSVTSITLAQIESRMAGETLTSVVWDLLPTITAMEPFGFRPVRVSNKLGWWRFHPRQHMVAAGAAHLECLLSSAVRVEALPAAGRSVAICVCRGHACSPHLATLSTGGQALAHWGHGGTWDATAAKGAAHLDEQNDEAPQQRTS